MGKSSTLNRMISAPAAMILAAAVTTAISSDCVAVAAQPNLTWAIHSGSTTASIDARGARAFLAHQAASKIIALDRASCAAPTLASDSIRTEVHARATQIFAAVSAPQFEPLDCTHQHAAP